MLKNNFVIGSIDGEGFWSAFHRRWGCFEDATKYSIDDIAMLLHVGCLPSTHRPVVIPMESVDADRSTSPRVREARDFFDRMNKE